MPYLLLRIMCITWHQVSIINSNSCSMRSLLLFGPVEKLMALCHFVIDQIKHGH